MTKQYTSALEINMTGEASLQFKLRKIDETRNYLSDEIKHNDLMSEKHKKTCKYLSYVENLLISASKVTGCVSISAFTLLVAVPVSIKSYAIGLKILRRGMIK